MQARSVRLPMPQACARVVASLAVLVQSLVPVSPALSAPSHPGKWTGAWTPTPQSVAVNLVLLPGSPSAQHSRVLMWDHDSDLPVTGRILGWNAPDDAIVNAGTFPTGSFPDLFLQDPPLQCVNGAATNIFCSGATHMADGRLFVSGGTDLGESGLRSALIFDPSADANGDWVLADTMKYRRWYPDNTLLPDGRLLTVAGSYAVGHALVGGIVDTSPADTATRLLQRFPVGRGSAWESNVVPRKVSDQSPLEPFSDATGVGLGGRDILVFGGRDAAGQVVNKARYMFRERNEYGADYAHLWRDLTQSGQGGATDLPPALTGATLVQLDLADDVLLIGGRNQSGVPRNELYRGKLDANRTSVTWNRLQTTLPVALHGASAVYDRSLGRVFLLGGSSTSDELPTNSNSTMYSIWVHPSDPTAETATIDVVSQSAPVPGETVPQARAYGTLTMDPIRRPGLPSTPTSGTTYGRAMLFGGRAPDNSLPAELCAAWFKDPLTVEWKRITPDPGPVPTGRVHHGAAADANAQWLVVTGGETASGTSSSEVWAFDLQCAFGGCNSNGSNHWEPLPSLPTAVRGHVAAGVGAEPLFSRIPEVYDPRLPAGCGAPYSWTALDSAAHLQEWFSFGMVAPRKAGGSSSDSVRVFFPGPEFPSGMLHLGRVPPRWENMTSASAGDYRSAGAAVMYRPGRVMKAGTRDTGPGVSLGTTAVIDLNSPNPVWVKAAQTDEMISRKNHNLVLLPTGEVIVVGGGLQGGADGGSTDLNVVKMPQIWNPDTLAAGHWYGQERDASNELTMRFDSSTVRRYYHGSAVLLPDGRILCAGGAFDPTEAVKLDLYSPYYLFAVGGGPATRPVIANAPARVSYAERFILTLSAADNQLGKVSLVRPGAATHGFDQNQRFVPLTFSLVQPGPGGQQRFLVSAPADSFDAPPGDYMLFALNSAGTPSIASWVRLGAVNGDTDPPSTVINLTKVCSHGTSVDLEWSPPREDASDPVSGPVALYDLRYSTGPLDTPAQFNDAMQVPGEPLPVDPVAGPGQTLIQGLTVDGLTANTGYTFRLMSRDHSSGSGNWSAMSNALTLVTHVEECGGAGGGGGGGGHEGASARRTAGGTWLRRTGGGTGGDPAFLENTLLPNVAPGVVTNDLVRLPYGPLWTATGARVQLSRTGVLGTRFTRVRLRGVSLAAGEEAFPSGDSILVGSLTPPARVWHADGRDLTAQLAADSAFDCHEADTLYVEFANALPGRVALETSGAHLVLAPDRTGFDVQCETAEGWQTVAHHDPRERRADALHELPGMGRVRLVSLGVHRLHGVARFEPGAPAAVTVLEPQAVTHSTLGDVSATLASGGAVLAHGESMLADFGITPEQAGALDWFLEVTGAHEAVTAGGTSSGRGTTGETAPVRFALSANRPNPFGAGTRIEFALPVRSDVRLEVFDLLGRRVATLASGTYEAGRHAVTWDRRSRSGARAAAGIYAYRLVAGPYREQRLMVVSP